MVLLLGFMVYSLGLRVRCFIGYIVQSLSSNPVSASDLTLKTSFWLAERSFGRAAIGQTRIWCPYQSNQRKRWTFGPFSLSFYSSFDFGPKGGKSRFEKKTYVAPVNTRQTVHKVSSPVGQDRGESW